MAAGLPVIVTREVALASDVARAGAGLVTPARAPEELARAIAQLSSPSARAERGAAARLLVERQFSIAALGKALVRLYEEVLNAA
jgi:glycosyltransferase involved in cell wall biosynthesis